MFSKLMYISQGKNSAEQLHNISNALDAGCKWIQLRFKNSTETDIKITAEKIKHACGQYKATFIINDDVFLTKEIDADGVHLGLTDMSIYDARKIIGNKVIGGTANTIEHILQRVKENADYIGLGPYRFTTTKEKLSPVLGLQGYKNIIDELRSKEISIPVYAIGGIGFSDIAELMQTGIYGIAASGMITNSADKKTLIKDINTVLNGKFNYC